MPKRRKPLPPIAERRGIQAFMAVGDASCAMLVRADVEQTARELARDLGTENWRKDVPRKALPACGLRDPRFYPFQYRGHDWTTVVHRYEFMDDLAKRLSAALRIRAIWVGYEDVSGSTDYTLYDSGRLKEVFHLFDPKAFHALEPAEMELLDRRGGLARGVPPLPHGYFAGSQVRSLNLADFKALLTLKGRQYGEHLERLFDDFLRSQDAFLGFNGLGEVGTEFYPLDEAGDDEILRIDVVEK
jgi:hypothetical protein